MNLMTRELLMIHGYGKWPRGAVGEYVQAPEAWASLISFKALGLWHGFASENNR